MSLLVEAIAELSAMDVRSLLSRTDRSSKGRGSELRPRLREAIRAGELAPEDVLRRLDEDVLEALVAAHGLAGEPSKKHAVLSERIATAIKTELAAEEDDAQRRRKKKRKKGDDEPVDELERLRSEVDRLLDERARLEAQNRRLRHELDRADAESRATPDVDELPQDLAAVLRSVGVNDLPAYKRVYRSVAKLLHPDAGASSRDGEAAFRILTRIRDLLEGRS